MPTFKVEGMDDFIDLCIKTDRTLTSVIGKSIYPAGEHMGNAVKTALRGVRTDDYKDHSIMKVGPTKKQLDALIESFGIAKMHAGNNGYNVKIGFDGYNDVVTKKYPKGQPNAMIARSVNKGTSFMVAQPFMDRTVRAEESKTVDIIKENFEKQMERIWK